MPTVVFWTDSVHPLPLVVVSLIPKSPPEGWVVTDDEK